MKLLLYCTKAKPYLQVNRYVCPNEFDRYILDKKQWYSPFGEPLEKLNGKIVAECDHEVEEIKYRYDTSAYKCNNINDYYYTNTLNFEQLEERSCLTNKDLLNCLGQKVGYAIHIKNLHIFDEPRELDNKPCVLISIRPEWLCKILNGEKTIVVRKKVLKEMLK